MDSARTIEFTFRDGFHKGGFGYDKKRYILESPDGALRKAPIYSFTRTGNAIAGLLDVKPNAEYFSQAVEVLRKSGFLITDDPDP